jgi:RNA-directed DNA polymerase
VFCETKEDAAQVVEILTEWLKERGLELSKEKTKIVHLTEGFDFLGFNIRHYEHKLTARTGWKLLIKPSNESVQKIREKLRDKWCSQIGHNVMTVIKELNPIIRGWANFARREVANRVFKKLDNWMFLRERRFTKRTHPTKSWEWRQARYFGRLNFSRKDNWVFGDKHTGKHLLKFSWFRIERHILVKGSASPDDANLREYWAKRNVAKAANLKPKTQVLAKKQRGKCLRCGESLFNGEDIHLHHKVWKSKGGKDSVSNLELIHLFCHQQIHAGTPTGNYCVKGETVAKELMIA